MSDSKRKLIRYKIQDMLTGISGVVAGSVYLNRSRKVYPEEMPALIIYTRTEQAEIEIEAPRAYKRTLRVAVEIVTDTKDDDKSPDDVVDDIAQEIETRLFRDETLGGLADDLKLSDTEMETNSDGDTMHAAARITFEVEYWTDAPEEQEGLDDFETVHSEMVPADGIEDDTAPAVDEIELDTDP